VGLVIASRVLKNFLSLSAAGFVHSIIAVISTIYLARVLGPEGYGRVNFAFAFVQYFLIISAIGLDTIGVREVARHKEKVKEFIGSILSLKLTLAFLLFLVLLVVIPLLNRPGETNRLLFIYALVLFPSALFLEWTWQGLERMGNIGAAKIIRQVLYLLLLLWFVNDRNDIGVVPMAFLGVYTLYAIILYTLFLKDYGSFNLSFDSARWKILLQESIPIGVSLFLGTMIYSLNTVFLSFFRSDAEVGYYNAAFQVISFMLVFMAVFFDTIFPTISSLYHTSRHKMEKILSLSGKVLMLITFPVAVGGTVLAPRLMHLLFGNRYDGGIVALQILVWVLAVAAANTIYARGLLAGSLQNYYMKVVALQTTTIIILDLILIKPFGIKGAAFATLMAETVGLYFYYKGFTTTIGKVYIQKTVLPPILASLIMGVFLYSCSDWSLFFVTFLGAVIYVAMIYLLKGIEHEEMRWIMDRALGRAEGSLL
jgi:O-antigen/teichoic acid export membrane protein